MSSDARIAANQANSALSTGPVTAEGKAASSRNNLRHGFRSRSESVLLPGDDPAEYEALLADLTHHFAPQDITEQRFVREMVDAEWRLRRVRGYMQAALAAELGFISSDPDLSRLGTVTMQRLAVESIGDKGGASYGTWLRYESKFERQYERAHRGWLAYQSARIRSSIAADFAALDRLTAPPPTQAMASNVQNHEVDRSTPSPTPRSTPCPCGSGEKYKRCCGKEAPPVLSQAA